MYKNKTNKLFSAAISVIECPGFTGVATAFFGYFFWLQKKSQENCYGASGARPTMPNETPAVTIAQPAPNSINTSQTNIAE